MFCSGCGAELSDGARFCRKCGTQVSGAVPSAQQTQSAQQDQAQPRQQAYQQQPQQQVPSTQHKAPASKSIEYIANIPAVYAKGEIAVEQNFLKLRVPNIILSFIPVGAKNNHIPVNQIASVSEEFKLSFGSLVLGLIAAFIGLYFMMGSGHSSSAAAFILFGLILLVVGVCTVINAFHTNLTVHTTAGMTYDIPFLIFDKSKCEEAHQLVGGIIDGRLNDTNSRQVIEAQTYAILGAMQQA